MITKNPFYPIRLFHLSFYQSYFLSGIFTFFLITGVQEMNEQAQGSKTAENEAEGLISETEIIDSIPNKRRIKLLPSEGNNYTYLFAFYDSIGNLLKKATDRQLQSYSNYSALNFPKMKELKGEPVKVGEGNFICYNLQDIPFAQKKKALREANIIGVPDSVIFKANYIYSLFGGAVENFYEGDNYIITTSNSRFMEGDGGQYSYNPFFDQTCISVFDFTGNPIFKIDVNYFVTDAIISEDGRFLLMFSVKGDFETHDLPFLIHDFKTNSTETVDLTEEYIRHVLLRESMSCQI